MTFHFVNSHRGTDVISNDDIDAFDTLLDRTDSDPHLLHRALVGYLDTHPGHTDAIAHLCLTADQIGDDDARSHYSTMALDQLCDAIAEQPPERALDWDWIANRPVLRLAHNATLAAWAARRWDVADALLAASATIADYYDVRTLADGIGARIDLGELRHGGELLVPA